MQARRLRYKIPVLCLVLRNFPVWNHAGRVVIRISNPFTTVQTGASIRPGAIAPPQALWHNGRLSDFHAT